MSAQSPDSGLFWLRLEKLIAESRIRIDRPKGSAHPRYPSFVYPLDYGYLDNTRGVDGNAIDVWRGSIPEGRLTGIICTVDVLKRDSEIKLLIGCTDEEVQAALATHNSEFMSGVLLRRPDA